MRKIERSRASVSDYEEIWRYIARDNSSAADRQIVAFEDQLQDARAALGGAFAPQSGTGILPVTLALQNSVLAWPA